jgi:RNA polymerase sigma-70 factor, ECF subfamily
VNAFPNTEAESRDPTVTTLGDVLYANPSRPPIPEAEWALLVQSIARGDQSALHALYLRAHRIVFTLIMRLVRRRETAEELTLDVFHDVWRRAAEYDSAAGSVVGWIMNQARWRALDRLRFEQRKKRSNGHGEHATEIGEAVEEIIVDSADEPALRNALAALAPEERQAIETAFFSELTHVETAARLNAPVGTVKTRIRSGLHKLRRALNEPQYEP